MISFHRSPQKNCSRTWVFTIRKPEMNSEVTKFASDMIFFRVVKLRSTRKNTLKTVGCWVTVKWKIKFLVDKCEVIYIGKIILPKQWSFWLVIITQNQELGTIIASCMKMSAQCSVAIKKSKLSARNYKERNREGNPTKQKKPSQKTMLYKISKNPLCAPFSVACAILSLLCILKFHRYISHRAVH